MIFLVLLFLASASATKCRYDEDCKAVSENKHFVHCVAGSCECLLDNGFVGAATPSSKCSCPPPSQFIWTKPGKKVDDDDDVYDKDELKKRGKRHEQPYCLQLPAAVTALRNEEREKKLMGVVRELYGDLLWPNPAIIMQQIISGNMTGGIWDRVVENATGRVDPLGEFHGRDGVVEYFVGTLWTGAMKISQVIFTKLLSRGNYVSSSVDMLFNAYNASDPSAPPYIWNYTQSGFFTFNDRDQIQSMDLIIHNLGFAPQPYPVTIEATCNAIMVAAKCNATSDPKGFYTDMDDCLNFMKSIPFGNYDNLRQSSVTCRSFHSILAIGRPEVHCPHTGKTGIGADGMHVCTPHTYEQYYDQQF